MPTEVKIRKSSSCTLDGYRHNVIDFKCPRCMNIVMYFDYEKAPLVCRCGCILANFKAIGASQHERISWHFHYMTKGN